MGRNRQHVERTRPPSPFGQATRRGLLLAQFGDRVLTGAGVVGLRAAPVPSRCSGHSASSRIDRRIECRATRSLGIWVGHGETGARMATRLRVGHQPIAVGWHCAGPSAHLGCAAPALCEVFDPAERLDPARLQPLAHRHALATPSQSPCACGNGARSRSDHQRRAVQAASARDRRVCSSKARSTTSGSRHDAKLLHITPCRQDQDVFCPR